MLLVTLLSAIVGIAFPDTAPYLSAAPFYGLMGMLYISFMSLRLNHLLGTVRYNLLSIAWFMFLRLILLPSVLYLLFLQLAPDYALAALLLGGAATGVVAPFIAFILGADVAFTTVLAALTSFALPFTLPFVALFWAGEKIDISLPAMVMTLVQMTLFPAMAVYLTRRFIPPLCKFTQDYGYSLGLLISFLSTWAIFARYADFFLKTPEVVVEGALVAVVVALLCGILGWLAALWLSPSVRLTFIISALLLNFTLIIVLSNEFFGPREAITAVLYTIPFFGTIIPLRAYMLAAEKKKTKT